MNLKRTLRVETLLVALLVSVTTLVLMQILLNLHLAGHSLGDEILHINAASTQSANAVTSVVTYFRGLDTLGEVSILFLSIFGVALHMPRGSKNLFSYHNTLLYIGVSILFPLMLLFGVYVILHGHLSPGGGFQGGVIIAGAFLLRFLTYGDHYELKERVVSLSESLSGAGFIVLGLLGLLVGDRIFTQILPLGTLGELLSGGVIELIYIFVGLKVSAEISLLAEHFVKAHNV